MMNPTFFSRGTFVVGCILAMCTVGCDDGDGSSGGNSSQAPPLHTLAEYSFDQGEDITEFSPEMEDEDVENTLENALLSRHWLFFNSSLQTGDSSFGNSLAASGTTDPDMEEFSEVVRSFAGKVNLGAIVIGDKADTRLKFVGIQSYNESASDKKSFTFCFNNGDIPEEEGGLMMLVFGLEGANGFAASPTFEIPRGDIRVTFTCWEDEDGRIFLDNILVQGSEPAPNQWDCPELMDFFYVIRDLAEEEQEKAEESEEEEPESEPKS